MRNIWKRGARLGVTSGLIGAVAVLAGCADEADEQVVPVSDIVFCTSPASMPPGLGWPAAASQIAGWVANRDEQATREHGWKLFAGLQEEQGAGWTWQSWCTETQAFSIDDEDAPRSGGTGKSAALVAQSEKPMRAFKIDNGLTTGEEPINFKPHPIYAVPQPVLDNTDYKGCIVSTPGEADSLANGPTLQNNGDVMLAGVIYNSAAYDWIRQNQLYSAEVLQGMRPPQDETKQIADFPSEAIVLKPMLWPISQEGYTAVPVWDDLSEDYGKYSGFEIQTQWPRAVAVTTGPVSSDPVEVTMLANKGVTLGGSRVGPNTYEQASPVSIDDFYSFEPDFASMDPCDRALIDTSAYYAYGRTFEQGDRLALVAMHIQTKEQESWTFQSVWWSDRPDEGPYSTYRPEIAGAGGPSQHYLMASTYDWPAEPGGSTWPIAYNPYIELAAAHPIKTNCQNCHQRSAFPGQKDGYLATGGPGALEIYSYDDEEIFAGLIGADSLWSIPDRALCRDGSKPPCSDAETAARSASD
ncbi:hypothetical protein ACI5KX_09125 [Erythrobacter sp. GH1-10]|uniref:hypothetical protein n=1 Tax=Erythrobacter sp. GH1-10 TaxID=3349334 RepID=UPI003877F94E